jgi:YvrJ protein family
MATNLSDWITLLRDVGFPIVISVYLLLRFEKKIDNLSATIKELKQAIQKKNN